MHRIIKKSNDFVAQLVEQLTLNQWVEGSSPSEVTTRNGKTLRTFDSQRLFSFYIAINVKIAETVYHNEMENPGFLLPYKWHS